MKTNDLREFTQELLEAHGGTVVESSPNLLRVDAAEDLAERIGRTELSLAFNQRGLNDDPSSELATVGNPVFDRVLELAQEKGRLGIRFLAEKPKSRKRAPAPPALADGLSYGKPTSGYAPLYFHVFKVRYSVEEIPDALEVVVVDGVSCEVQSETPDVVELWSTLSPVPDEGRTAPPVFPAPDEVLRAGLAGLERRLRRRIGRLKRDAHDHLAKEGESIGTYYQNLIEEARTSKRKLSGGLQAREEKIRLLQLDWKRRMEEAQDFWRPKVDVQLSGLGVILRPSQTFPVLRGKKRIGEAHWCPEDRAFLIPPTLSGGTV